MSRCPLVWNDPRPYSALSGMEQSSGGVGFQRADLAEQDTEPAIVGHKMGVEPPTHVCRMSTVRASLHAAMLPGAARVPVPQPVLPPQPKGPVMPTMGLLSSEPPWDP